MFKSRNLLVIGIALVTMMVLLIPLASAEPAQQATATPTAKATAAATAKPAATATVKASPTSVATAVKTPVGTPSTLPKTGGSDDGTAALSLTVIAVGAIMLLGAFGLARASRRTH